MDRDTFAVMTVVQLKDFLRKKGARLTGNKEELIDLAYAYATRVTPIDNLESKRELENDYKILPVSSLYLKT